MWACGISDCLRVMPIMYNETCFFLHDQPKISILTIFPGTQIPFYQKSFLHNTYLLFVTFSINLSYTHK